MNIFAKQTNHPKSAAAKSFNVKRRTQDPEWFSAIPRQDGLGIRIDLGETGSVVIDVTSVDELKVLAAVVNKAIKNLEEN